MSEKIMPAYITVKRDDGESDKYTLDFSRESVIFAQSKGFALTEEYIDKHQRTVFEDLFWYSFRMNHKNVAREKVDKIREKWNGLPESLVKRLCDLYTQALTANNVQPDEDAEKNGEVTLEL